MNILTIIILGIILVFALIGHARGFVRMLLSVLSLVVTLYVATLISPYVSEALQKTSLYDSVYDSSYEYVNTAMREAAADDIDSIMDEMHLPEGLKHNIANSEVVKNGTQEIAARIATKVTQMIFDALIFLVTFIVAMFAVKIIFAAIDIMTHIPIIHGMNQMVGAVVGAAEGILIVWLFFIVINLLGNSEFAVDMYRQINESRVLTFLYNNNAIMNLLFR